MKHLFEYSSFYKKGKNPNDLLGWGDEIESVIKTTLVGRKFKGHILEKVVVNDAESKIFYSETGSGIVQLFFKKEFPSEMDQLMADLSGVGLAEERKIEIGYNIQADRHTEDDEYSILVKTEPKEIPNFMGMTFQVFADNDYDMSLGIGKIVAQEIENQIDK
jgi:hypothetical protein